MSPVHIATLNNHADCVRLLIKAGSKVNQCDNDGWTPLMAAAAFAEHKLVKMLLEAGANPTRRAQAGHHKGMNAKDLVKQVPALKYTPTDLARIAERNSPYTIHDFLSMFVESHRLQK